MEPIKYIEHKVGDSLGDFFETQKKNNDIFLKNTLNYTLTRKNNE